MPPQAPGANPVRGRLRRAWHDSLPHHLRHPRGLHLFRGSRGPTGRELWRSDGTAAGTTLVDDVSIGSNNSNPSELTASGSTLYFAANTFEYGVELWKTANPATDTATRTGGYPSIADVTAARSATMTAKVVGTNLVISDPAAVFSTNAAVSFDGTISLGGAVAYTGLEPMLMSVGSLAGVVFNLPAAASTAVLEDDCPPGNATSELRSANGTFETTTFTKHDERPVRERYRGDQRDGRARHPGARRGERDHGRWSRHALGQPASVRGHR